MQAIRDGLAVRTDIGGIARYTNDYYFQQSGDIDKVPAIHGSSVRCGWPTSRSNPRLRLVIWPLRAEHWNGSSAMRLESGVLPEQLNPFDGTPLSVRSAHLVACDLCPER